MDIQIKASFKKEILAFSRTKMFIIIAIILIGMMLTSPLMIRGLALLMDAMSDIYEEFGMDITALTGELSSNATLGATQAVSDVSQMGLLVFLLLINGFAGGEQKKRSTIIPRSAGLGSMGYILPKFIIYPLTAFVLGFIGLIAASWVSVFVFDNNDIIWSGVFTAGVLIGVYLMLYICLHLAIGTATGKAGLSSAACIVAALLLPTVFAVMDPGGEIMAYNPFALNTTANYIINGAEVHGEAFISAAFAVGIMVAMFFIALFAQNAKKVDNTGNEILI